MLRNNSIIEGKLENIVDRSKLGRKGRESFHLHRLLHRKSQELWESKPQLTRWKQDEWWNRGWFTWEESSTSSWNLEIKAEGQDLLFRSLGKGYWNYTLAQKLNKADSKKEEGSASWPGKPTFASQQRLWQKTNEQRHHRHEAREVHLCANSPRKRGQQQRFALITEEGLLHTSQI